MILFQNNYPHVLLAHAVSSIAYKQTNDVHGVYEMYFFVVCFAISLLNIITIYHVLPLSGLVLFEVLFSLSLLLSLLKPIPTGELASISYSQAGGTGVTSAQKIASSVLRTMHCENDCATCAMPLLKELLKPVDCSKECLLI